MRNVKKMLVLLLIVTSACAPLQAGGMPAGEPTGTGGNGDVPLAGTQWELASFGEPGAETQVIQGSTVTLEFEADGQAGGSGGCNSYGANYEIRDGNLSFDEITSTLRACADEQVSEQEQQYFAALQSTARYELSGNRLAIWYADGQDVLNFVKVNSN